MKIHLSGILIKSVFRYQKLDHSANLVWVPTTTKTCIIVMLLSFAAAKAKQLFTDFKRGGSKGIYVFSRITF